MTGSCEAVSLSLALFSAPLLLLHGLFELPSEHSQYLRAVSVCYRRVLCHVRGV